MDPYQATCDLTSGCENIAHVVKEDESEIVTDERERDWRSANFYVVDEQPLPANGISGLQVTWAGLVDGVAAERIATSSEEQLRQGNGGGFRRQHCAPRREAQKVVRAVGVQNPDLGVPRQHPSFLEGVVRRILEQHLAIIRFGAQSTGGQSKFGDAIASLVRVNRVVAGVPYISKTRNREPHWL